MKHQYDAKDVKPIAQSLMDMLRPYTNQIEIAGSLRRGNAIVGDVEIVARPVETRSFLDGLDRLRRQQVVKLTAPVRWGERYRAFWYRDVKFDLFITDRDSWGYIFWLRTGPSDANTYLVSQLKYRHAPVRGMDGGVFHVRYERSPAGGAEPTPVNRLSIPDERTWFRAMGLRYLVPGERSREAYQAMLKGHSWPTAETLVSLYVPPEMKQASLFGWD